MPSDKIISGIVQGVATHLPPLAKPDVSHEHVPSTLVGKLAAAHADIPSPLAPVDATAAPFAFGAVRAQNVVPWKGLRTRADVFHAFTRDAASARTLSAAIAAASALPNKLMSTGAYRAVTISDAASSDGHGTDLIVSLDERNLSLNTGVAHTLAGRVEAVLHGGLVINAAGFCETVTASIGSTGNEISMSTFSDIFSRLPGLGSKSDAPASVHSALSPTFTLAVQFPVVMGALTPVALRFRAETERQHALSGFTNRAQEVEASITDPSNVHSASYTLSWRNIMPQKHAGSTFAFAASPEIVRNADSSLKSSIAYSYVRNKLNQPSLPSRGLSTMFRAELAGLGGDVSFFKAAINWLAAGSMWRYAPDTGYQLPLSHSAWLQMRAAAAASSVDTGVTASFANALRPHPSHLFAPPSNTSSPASDAINNPHGSEYTWQHRVAGWLSPGITVNLDAGAGIVVPAPLVSSPLPGVRVIDRFFLNGARFRGYDAVGPAATPVPGGSPSGDLLGGDVMAVAMARVLLPPPFPSVRLANAGLRSQLFASVGTLANRADVPTAAAFASRASAAAGVGLLLPLGDAACAEMNYTLWSSKQPSDVVASFKFQLSM